MFQIFLIISIFLCSLRLLVPNSMLFTSSPSRRREAPCEGTNPPWLFTPGETKALAKSKVHQWSRCWVGGHPHWSQKYGGLSWIADTDWSNLNLHYNDYMTTAKLQTFLDLMIDKFLANIFHFCSHFCKIL
jgi:hypothetical protein